MKDKQNYTFELEPVMYDFLQEMVEQYGLSDVDKALRCLINYAREEDTQQEEIFSVVRCLDC